MPAPTAGAAKDSGGGVLLLGAGGKVGKAARAEAEAGAGLCGEARVGGRLPPSPRRWAEWSEQICIHRRQAGSGILPRTSRGKAPRL